MMPVASDASKFLRIVFILFFIVALSACGGGGGGGGSQTPGPTPVDVNGGGVKGPLIDAILTVYLLDYSQPDFKGAVVGTGTTGADASIVDLSIVPTGGPYLFEFTSDLVGPPITTDMTTGQPPVITTMRTVVVDDAGLSNLIYGTPLTTAVVDLALANADSNVAPYTGNNDGTITEAEFLAALDIAKGQVLATLGFGLATSVDIFTASPIINANTTDAASQGLVAQYRTAIEALTTLVNAMAVSAGSSTDDMFAAVIDDLADDSQINHSPASTPITATEIAILEDPNPAALIIPNTTTTVGDVETILADERSGTGNDGVDVTPMPPVDPAPAEPVSNIDGDAHPDSSDNCPTVANDDQADVNANGIGDACETLVSVPNVVGSTQTDAGTAITGANLNVGVITQQFSNTVAAGLVISQDPTSGTQVLSDTDVNLVISLGPDFRDVPNVIGQTQAGAQVLINNAGLNANPITFENSMTVAAGLVISQNPTVGNQLVVGSDVAIVVSLGPPMVDVPDVVNLAQATAEADIVAANLVVGTVTTANSDTITAGNVISQDPAAGGAQVLAGTSVDLVVSLGPQTFPVPNYAGMTRTAAEAEIVADGFAVGNVTYANSDTVAADIVISHNPANGQQAILGSPIDLLVSAGPIDVQPENISGIWRLQSTGFTFNGCGTPTGGDTSPEYLLSHTNLVQYMSVEQPGGGNAINVRFPNGIVATGLINGDGSLQFDGVRNWQTNRGENMGISYDVSGTFVAGAPDTLDLTVVDATNGPSSSCSQNISYTAEHVYNPTTDEEYNGTYKLEAIQKFSNGPDTDRESSVYDIGIQGTAGSLSFIEDDGVLYHLPMNANFDPATGFAALTNVENIVRDHDGDGNEDDLEHVEVQFFILYVRSDTDTSDAPTVAVTWYESTTVFLDTVVYPGTGNGTVFEHDDDFSFGYGKLVQPTGFTVSSYEPINNTPNEEQRLRLGIHHPPLLGLDQQAINTFEIVPAAGGSAICGGNYPDHYRHRVFFPNHVAGADMTQEEFWPRPYSFINCAVDPNAVLNNGAYTMNIRNSSNVVLYAIPITAEPTTFASTIPNRRAIDVDGAMSSRTRRGNTIRLHGFFNPSFGNNLSITVPASSDPDLDYYRIRFFNNTAYPNMIAEFDSNSNTFTIPGDTVFDSENGINLDLRLDERYLRLDGRRAQSRSRLLRMQPGIRALVNTEVVNPTTGEVAIGQAWLNGSNEFPNTTTCIMTKPLDGSVTCSPGTINFSTNTITIPVNIGGIPTTMTITFTDSVTGTASVYDPIDGDWTGTVRVVNPELVTRTQIDRNSNQRTDIIYVNPLAPTAIPDGGTGVLTSALSQDLGAGAGVAVYMWQYDYSTLFNSFAQTPLDGGYPQATGAYRAISISPQLVADTFTLQENGRTFRTDYGGEDASSMLPPSRNQIWIDFGAGDVSASTYSYVNQTEITSQPVTLSWTHTPGATPANTRWQIRLREVLTAGDDHVRHSETRTARLADGEDGLSYNAGTGRWTWVVPPEFQIPSTGIWKFNVRVSNPENTIRGIGQGVVMVDQVANP